MEKFTDSQPPFKQRKSQNLHFKDYFKDTLFWASLPLVGGIVTFIGGRISRNHFNNKLWPLDGSPTIVQTLWEKGLHLFTKKTFNVAYEVGEVERLGFFTQWLPEEKRLNATRDFWNFAKGTELALIPTAFHFWRRTEKQRLDLQPAYDRLRKLGDMNPTDAELREDNASLKAQLAYLDSAEKPAHVTGHKEHQGRIHQPHHSQALHS